MNIANQEN